ncbi:unnamed protein product [Ectocarpus sp. 8 AP-2014]
MLRSLPRSVCRSARSSRAPDSNAPAAAGLLEASADRSVRPCGSWTAAAAASAKRQPRAIPHVGPLPTTAYMKFPLVRSMSSLKSSQWEREGLPVAPVHSGSEALPSNLKLAVEAWPAATAGEGGDAKEDAEAGDEEEEEEETDPLSEEDHDAIAALLDIPGLAATDDLEVEVVAWADGAPVATVSLAPSVFGVPVRRDVVHEVVRWQLARRRKGNGQTKRIGEISGSGRKVRPQKGGGVARAGHSRPPHWRGGAKAHGPRRRDFSFKLNKKFVRLGLKVALSARLREGQLKVVDDLKSDGFRTSAMIKTIKARGIDGPVTFVVGGDPQVEFMRSVSNIVGAKVLPARGANVHDIIKRPNLVLTQDAVTHLEEFLQTP